MRSLQGRLLAGSAFVIAIGFLAGSIIVHAATRVAMYAEFDRSLLARAESLTVLVEHTEEGIDVEFDETDFEEFTRDVAPDLFQIWHPDGRSLSKSFVLKDRSLNVESADSEHPVFSNISWQDEPSRRQVVIQWYPVLDIDEEDQSEDDDNEAPLSENGDHQDEDAEQRSNVLLTIAVARQTAVVAGQLGRLSWLLLLVGTTVTLCCLAGLAVVIRCGLRPIHDVAAILSTIDETRLGQQIAPAKTPEELTPIVRRLNEMLERLKAAFQREREFSSNVAHELRTPLAGLRSTIEVHLSRPHKPVEYRAALQSCLDICNQSSEMVETLLSLSRVERRQNGIERQSVQVDRILRECWSTLETRSKAKGLRERWNVSPIAIETDPEKLRVVLRNVLANAVSHSDPDGTLDVTTSTRNGTVEIQVANSGNQLNAKQLERVFDRFWRGDSSRSGTGEHFGLGLTLVKSLVEVLDGTVTVNAEKERFQVDLTFPRESALKV